MELLLSSFSFGCMALLGWAWWALWRAFARDHHTARRALIGGTMVVVGLAALLFGACGVAILRG